MRSPDPASHFSSPHDSRRKLGELQDKDRLVAAHQVEKRVCRRWSKKNVDKIWTTTNWAIYDGKGTAFDSVMEDHYMVAKQKCVEHGQDSITEECSGAHRCRSGRVKGTTGYCLWKKDRAARKM